MKKILSIFLILALIPIGVYAAKVINVTTTEVVTMTVATQADGVTYCIVEARILDSGGNEVKRVYKAIPFDDLTVPVRAGINLTMRFLSKEINNEYADENSETWTDQ
jgi:hypothetical protein